MAADALEVPRQREAVATDSEGDPESKGWTVGGEK